MATQVTTTPSAAPAPKPVALKPATVAAIPLRYVALLVPANPKKPGSASAARFALYQHGMTTSAYQDAVVKAGQAKRLAADDIRWDVRHGFISLHATAKAADEAKAAPKKAEPKAA